MWVSCSAIFVFKGIVYDAVHTRLDSKCAGKSILKRRTQHLMKGKGRTCKRKHNPSTALSLMLKSVNSAKHRHIRHI